jgi:caffeoyl-CoA O-methyltransferase
MGESIGLSPRIRAYVQSVGVREHPVLRRCREETARLPDARMQISPEQGAFMQTLARAIRARRAIEVGVFTGYSSTAVALVLKALHGDDALLIACDASPDYLKTAHGYWRDAGVEDVVEPRVGPAADRLRDLLGEGVAGRFDLAFIDADKTGYELYYEACLELLRPGGVMLLDNMLYGGQVADEADRSPAVEALRALARAIQADQRVDMVLAPLGDGLSIVVKR